MLATQMALVHMAATKLAVHLAANNVPQQDKAERALKCMRTFTTQVEALQRYRTWRRTDRHGAARVGE